MHDQPLCLGVDGCPGGWVGVSRAGARVHESLGDLVAGFGATVVAIDMPIGLPDDAPRRCEIEARRLLGWPRSTSVFPVPMRTALGGTGYIDASELNHRASGRRLTRQTYNIMPKIQQLDTLLSTHEHYRAVFWEVHPELSFACMNLDSGQLRPLAEPKKSQVGASLRRGLIASHFGESAFCDAVEAVAGTGAARDDIADAFACLFSAERIAGGRHVSLPANPPQDACGLPMRICY